MNIKIQLMLYSIEGIILLFFIINEKKHLINSPIIILVLGTIFILLGIIIFCWEIFLLQIRGIIGFGPECMGRSEDAILFWRT